MKKTKPSASSGKTPVVKAQATPPAATPSEAQRLAAAILEVLAGVRSPPAASELLGISLPRYYQLEARALEGLVAALGPLIPRLRNSFLMGALLDGVNVAALGLMAAVTWQLAQAALVDWLTALLAIVSAILLFRFKINSAWLVLGGGLVGLLYWLLTG